MALKQHDHGGVSTVRPMSTVPSTLTFLPAYIPVHAKTDVAAMHSATHAKIRTIVVFIFPPCLAPQIIPKHPVQGHENLSGKASDLNGLDILRGNNLHSRFLDMTSAKRRLKVYHFCA
jgi:hypothetical protein